MLQPFLLQVAAENSNNIVQLRLSTEKSHVFFQSATEKNGKSCNIVEQWFPCVRTFPSQVNTSSLYLASSVDMERFLNTIRESDHEIHLILEESLSDDQDQHESLRRILAAVSEQGKLTSLKCCFRENSTGFPMKTMVQVLEKCRLVRYMHIELMDEQKFDSQPLVTCLKGHTIELKACLYNSRNDAESEMTILISPDQNVLQVQNQRNQIYHSVSDNFVRIDMPQDPGFVTDEAIPCEVLIDLNIQELWHQKDHVKKYAHLFRITAGLHKCPNVQFLHFGNCSLSDAQCDMVSLAIQNAPLLQVLDLQRCKIGDDGYKTIFHALQTTRHGLKKLRIRLDAPASLETAVSFFKVLVAHKQSLLTLRLEQSNQTRGESVDYFADYACYAVAKSIIFMTSIRLLSTQSNWDRISHEALVYKKLDDELNSYLLSQRAKLGDIQPLMAGSKNAKACLAWLLLSSLNKCQSFTRFEITRNYFVHDDDVFQTFLKNLPMNRSIFKLKLRGKQEEDCCREKVERLALQCAISCPRLAYTCTAAPGNVADPNDYRRITKQLTLFNKESRSVLEKTSSKKKAVEILVKFRNELCCLHIALLMNPALFFSM